MTPALIAGANIIITKNNTESIYITLEEDITLRKRITQDCQQGLRMEAQHEGKGEEKEKETVIGEGENEEEQFCELCNEVRYSKI